ncbi:hypothetical protein PROFUN_02423 [Planoprotostelium fungivorum]|uniref:Ankyrin repeat protein n=1 Tax=Planoprotostelium fungivorum TaxID=1890364 RepID=A0A2P6NUT0_9EUKA|nr:hypothetical protein PROFUN_02423 [Planoprotostelium fungivorum]
MLCQIFNLIPIGLHLPLHFVCRRFRSTVRQFQPPKKVTARWNFWEESSESVEELCAIGGHLHLLRWIHSVLNYPLTNNGFALCCLAAQHGHLHILDYVRSIECVWGGTVYVQAAREGHLNILQYAHEHHCPIGDDWDSSTDGKVSQGTILTSKERKNAAVWAARGGHLDVLKWIMTHHADWWDEVEVCKEAARAGHAEIVRWADENGYPIDFSPLTAAAVSCSFPFLQWIYEKGGILWTGVFSLRFVLIFQGVCAEAARLGKMQTLDWLRGHGCPWDKEVTVHLARNGMLDELEKVHREGCPWDQETFSAGLECSPQVAEWLLNHGCPVNRRNKRLAIDASERNAVQVVHWLHSNHFPVSDLRSSDTDTLEALHRLGFSIDRHLLLVYPLPDVFLWCLNHRFDIEEQHVLRLFQPLFECYTGSKTPPQKYDASFVFKEYIKRGGPWPRNLLDVLVREEDVELLQWCRDEGCPMEGVDLMTALMHSSQRVLEWAVTSGLVSQPQEGTSLRKHIAQCARDEGVSDELYRCVYKPI